MADFSAEDIVEEMPALDALRAFLAYLDLTDANAMDAKLHRSGRHPDDLHWSSNPRYANKAKVAGRISSTDDSALFLKLTKERDMRAKQAALRKKRLAAARVDVTNRLASAETAHDGAEAMTSASQMDAALRSVFRAYGRYRRFDAAGANKRTSDGNDEKTSDPVQDAHGVFELDCLGWQKLVRDCAMLDNAATAVDLDDLFSSVDAGEVGYDERNRDGAGGARRRAPNSATRSWSTRSSRFCFANVPSAGTSRNTHKKTPARPRPASNPRSRRNRKTRAWTPRTRRCSATIFCLAREADDEQ